MASASAQVGFGLITAVGRCANGLVARSQAGFGITTVGRGALVASASSQAGFGLITVDGRSANGLVARAAGRYGLTVAATAGKQSILSINSLLCQVPQFDAPTQIGGWILDIRDSNNYPLACGIPLVTGIDLLYQHVYLGIGGSLMVSTDGDLPAVPTFNNLGTTSHLWFVTYP